MPHDVSLLLPTRDRSDFVNRLLHYYHQLEFKGAILIGDSSGPLHSKKIKDTIRLFKDNLSIRYYEYPGFSNSECHQQLVDAVSTPYVAFLGDDDFLVPDALKQCATFLNSHLDYVSAHGKAILFKVQSDSVHGQLENIGYYPQPIVESATAAQRLMEHLRQGLVALFSVHRVDAWRLMFQDAPSLSDVPLATELLPSCLSVVLGKMNQLDCLYLARQVHQQRYRHIDIFDRLMSENWAPSFRTFEACLSNEITRIDGVSIDEARAIIKRAFWDHLARVLMSRWKSHYVASQRAAWQERMRRIPVALGIYQWLRSWAGQDKFLLPTLLNSSSPYHADFMPIYQSITTISWRE